MDWSSGDVVMYSVGGGGELVRRSIVAVEFGGVGKIGDREDFRGRMC